MGDANDYLEKSPPARTDMALGIDTPAGAWSIKRFQIADILGLIEDGDIPEGLTISAAGSVATGALVAALQTYAGIAPAADVQAILGAADYAAIRALLDLEAGTDFYSVAAADAAFLTAVTEADISDLGTTVTLNADADVSGNSWVLDEDDMSSDDDTKVATQQSTKAYVDTRKLTDIAVAADLTTHDVTIARPGLVPKASGNATDFLDGTGAWSVPGAAANYTLNVVIPDVSTAQDIYVAIPQAGDITLIQAVLQAAITVADAALTFRKGATVLTNSGITIAYSGSAPGDIASSTPSAANTFAVGDVLKISTDGGSTDAAPVILTILVEG
jgi:hypothetical protein